MDLPALLHPYIEDALSPAQLDQVSIYLDLLLRWNAKTNLTSVRDPEQIVTRHFGESLFLARKLFPPSSGDPPWQILDVGSGAGFPAIPLKIFRPGVTLSLVEAHHRKAVFLREVLRALHLEAEVMNLRAESLPAASAGLVTLRAVEKFDSVLPVAARLVRTAGTAPAGFLNGLALLIGSGQIARVHQLLPDWRLLPAIPVPNSQTRVIQLVEPNQ
jgi:16S rRNA (guanine527-N7)-methyltransferase